MNEDNSAMDLDNNIAKDLFETGGALIITGVPIGTDFGIDLMTYTIGEKFRGVKMIPPGPHFVWCASKGLYGDAAPRVGFVHFFKVKEIVVREWNALDEELQPRQLSESAAELEKRRLREHLYDLDGYLAPYDLRHWGRWKRLTDTITESTLCECQPTKGIIRTNVELQSCPDAERPRGAPTYPAPRYFKLVADEDDLLPNLKPIEGTAPRFTSLPPRIPEGSTPAEISLHSMDCIAAVNKLLTTFSNTNAVIEETQVSFIFFLVGYSVESLAHWRKILAVLSHSETAVTQYGLLYMKYSEILGYQLPHLPEELMEQTERNTVYKDVRALLFNLSVGGLYVSAEHLIKKLQLQMGWEFDGLLDEYPDDLPVVVDTI